MAAVGAAAAGALAYAAYSGYLAVDACFNPPKHCYNSPAYWILHDQPSLAGSEYLGSFFYDKVERREIIPGGFPICTWTPTVCEGGWSKIGQLAWERAKEHIDKAAAGLGGSLIAAGMS